MKSSIENLNSSIDELKGTSLYNSVADVCDKLDEVTSVLRSIEISMPL